MAAIWTVIASGRRDDWWLRFTRRATGDEDAGFRSAFDWDVPGGASPDEWRALAAGEGRAASAAGDVTAHGGTITFRCADLTIAAPTAAVGAPLRAAIEAAVSAGWRFGGAPVRGPAKKNRPARPHPYRR